MQAKATPPFPVPVLNADEIEQFLEDEFPQVHQDGRVFTIRSIEPGRITYRLDPQTRHLRPGGTVSGPALFALADISAYICILAHIGPRKHTVTTSLNINFMHKAHPGAVDCTATLLKLGKRLAVLDCVMRDSDGRLVAQATATYSIPEK